MKDTFFFSHDYNARTDPKMQRLLMKHGCAGIGAFWCIIEQIYEQGGLLPLGDCESIAFALRMDEAVIESIVKDFDLFKNDGVNFWSESVKQRLSKRAEIAEKRKNAAMNRWNKDAKNQEPNASAKQLQENPMQDYANKEKESKEKESKLNNNNESIEVDSSENEFSGASDSSSENDNDEQGKEKSSAKKEKIDFNAIVELYHKCCPSFPRIIKLSNSRKTKVKSRLAEMKNDWSLLESVFNAMEKSKFLRGENRNGWQASFDWVFDNEKNWLKVIEGNYNDKTSGNSKNVNEIWENQ